jgi:lysophospholipase L1-like esterase
MNRTIAGRMLLVCVGLSVSLPSAPAAEKVQLKQGDRIVFLGDSITQAGAGPNGYISLVRNKLNETHKDLGIEVIGAGISGNKVTDLQNRLDRDVIAKTPTIVVIYIGINDVWHSLNNRGTPKDKFESGLYDVIKRINDAGARVILCTASVIGEKTDGSNQLDEMLDDYCAVSRKVAKETGSQLLDLRQQFIDHLKKSNPDGAEKGVLTSDRVHLNQAGNQFVAARMLEALGVGEHSGKLLRHVVLFKFKDDVTADQIQEVVDAFAALPGKIDTIRGFEHGTDVSVEGKAEGYTHGFVVTFADEAGRAEYLPHAAHQEFVKLVGPRIDKVLVFDYWTAE